MSDFSRTLIARSGYGGRGFADTYDAFRPSPPQALLDVLSHVAQTPHPSLVVDLGCGTGLSTRAWSERADDVVGVEANPAMLEQAATAGGPRYVEATADQTGLPGGRADLVTCAQSFHWMEPAPVLAEAARLLRPGGAFAAYDYDWPPSTEPEIDAAFGAHQAARGEARSRLRLEAGAATWPKDRHLEQIRASGLFRHARELVCHGWEEVDAARVAGLAESIGGPRAIFGDRAPAVTETFERLRLVSERLLGDRRVPMLLCYRIRVGII
ncbi:MAG: class I SAM-dependent methyltransferase [Gaiellaceae bacterium]